jgi:hypothetical protein
MALKGVEKYAIPNPLLRSSFRTSMFTPEGLSSAIVLECTVSDYNLTTWTVDCLSKYDQLRYPNVQVASPYAHPYSGEGMYVVPDVGAKCNVCVPSDGSPPHVQSFVMPMETMTVGEGEDKRPASYTFQGGRLRPKPGDLVLKGRDGNFCILHRGGVLQIGSSQLSQRLFIPLEGIITDISQNYRHYNMAGAINWGIQPGGGLDKLPARYKHTFRLFADEEQASVRVAVGSASDWVAEPQGGQQENLAELELGTKDNPVVCELVIAPKGFNADAGDLLPNTPDLTTLRFFFDKAGGAFLRSQSSVLVAVKKKFKMVVDEDIQLEAKKGMTIKIGSAGRVQAGDTLDLSAGVVSINGGTNAVAHVGSMVEVSLVTPIPIIVGGVQGTITAGAKMVGYVKQGNALVRV